MKFFLSTIFTDLSQKEIRELYHIGIEDENNCNKLLAYFETNPPAKSNFILYGYQGANRMVSAKFVNAPVEKYKRFSSGKILLELAISAEPNNLELRYLRYSIQLNSPSFLNYNTNKVEDRKRLISELKNINDQDISHRIKSFLLAQGNLTPKEREQLMSMVISN